MEVNMDIQELLATHLSNHPLADTVEALAVAIKRAGESRFNRDPIYKNDTEWYSKELFRVVNTFDEVEARYGLYRKGSTAS